MQLCVYPGYPEKDVFITHANEFSPFYTRNCFIWSEQFLKVSDELLQCKEIVDVSCVNHNECFNGNPLVREKVQLDLSTFMNAFVAYENGEKHFLQNTNLQFYLSQCSVYSTSTDEPAQVPALLCSVTIPSILQLTNQTINQINIWSNIMTATSTLHYDANHNLLTCLKGSKQMTLISPQYTQYLKPCSASSASPNHSQLTSEELQQFLTQHTIDGGIHIVTIQAGDCLFIPEGWWHSVISEQCTLAVNYWFDSPFKKLFSDTSTTKHMLTYLLRAAVHCIADDCVNEPTVLIDDNISTYSRINKKRKTEACNAYYSSDTFSMLVDNILSANSSITLNSCQSDNHMSISLNDLCLEFVTCTISDMITYWLPYAIQNPEQWTKILLTLTPQAVHTLVTYWDTLSTDNSVVEGQQNNSTIHNIDASDGAANSQQKDCKTRVSEEQISSFFEDIFAGCGDRTTEVRKHLITQKDKWTERCSKRTINAILGCQFGVNDAVV